MHIKQKKENRIRRHRKVRSRVAGVSDCPRLSVFKSNRSLYAQLIDDQKGETLCAVASDSKGEHAKSRIERSHETGKKMAQEAKKKGIVRVVFDRGGFLYTGNIKAFAEGAREGGLSF